MRTISSNIAKQTFGRVLEAAQREPVLIEKHNHPTAVILSVDEYDRLKLREPEGSRQQSETTVAKAGVAKSLPIIPSNAGCPKPRLSAREMVDLVHEAESELDA